MTYAITLVALGASGLALVALLRLRTGHALTDVALAWLVGSGWVGAVAPVLRFCAGIRLGRAALAGVVLAPVVAWAVAREARRRRKPAEGAGAVEEPVRAGGATTRWLPRPLWVFAPIALYVAFVTAAVVLHGVNVPTHTDDAVRVRVFAPILAFEDAWEPAARGIFVAAGPLPTFVPAVAWIATGALDHFHANYAVLTELLALLALVIGVAAARGAPERGWAGALALLSVPLFVYHCTSTYSDAVLAMRVAGALVFAMEYARGADRADLARAALLLGIAALVKREGELVVAAPAAVLVAQAAWERWREGRPLPARALALLLVPGLLGAAAKIAAVGLAGAFPMLGFVAQQAIAPVVSGGARAKGVVASAAADFGEDAVLRSGNQGVLYWVLAAVIVARARALGRRELLWPLLAVLALFAEVAVNSVLIVPEFTLNGGTVHRVLLVASVPAALWVGAAIVDAARAEAADAEQPAPARRGAARS